MCARALLAHGASVTITSRSTEDAEKACQELAVLGTCDYVVANLLVPGEAGSLGRELAARHPRLDIVVNNAGATWGDALEDYPPAAWDRVLGLDVAAPFQVLQATLALLERTAQPGHPARVVNIGSVDGIAVGEFDNYAYSAAKAGLHHLTRVLARRLGRRNVTVNALAFGPIATGMMVGSLDHESEDRMVTMNPLGRLCEYDDVAGALIYLTAAAGNYVTGVVLPVDGGFSLAPWWVAATPDN